GAAAREGRRGDELLGAARARRRRHDRDLLGARQSAQGRSGRQHPVGEPLARAARGHGTDRAGGRMALMNVALNEVAAVHAHLNEVYSMLPFTPVKGSGVWLEDAAGRRVLDLYGGHAVAALGYAHPRLSETIARAARDLVFQTTALPLSVRDEAADALAAFAPTSVGRV